METEFILLFLCVWRIEYNNNFYEIIIWVLKIQIKGLMLNSTIYYCTANILRGAC